MVRRKSTLYFDSLVEGTFALSLSLCNVPEDQFHKIQWEGQTDSSESPPPPHQGDAMTKQDAYITLFKAKGGLGM